MCCALKGANGRHPTGCAVVEDQRQPILRPAHSIVQPPIAAQLEKVHYFHVFSPSRSSLPDKSIHQAALEVGTVGVGGRVLTVAPAGSEKSDAAGLVL
jgi:hypothetical protein